jgi:hypothetical protein
MELLMPLYYTVNKIHVNIPTPDEPKEFPFAFDEMTMSVLWLLVTARYQTASTTADRSDGTSKDAVKSNKPTS